MVAPIIANMPNGRPSANPIVPERVSPEDPVSPVTVFVIEGELAAESTLASSFGRTLMNGRQHDSHGPTVTE
jgi:hypothetical protein